MVNDFMINKNYWEDAIFTSKYIYNRLLHKGINNKISYLVKKKVDYSYVCEFLAVKYFSLSKNILDQIHNSVIISLFESFYIILTIQPILYNNIDITSHTQNSTITNTIKKSSIIKTNYIIVMHLIY